ncbi:hypothetical protein CEUSTIGMA_g3287.t1 [Chlamydomonas eustigma]|uniref:Guanylate cyclase domain-containing protein n=1 Tax=Chlamydomonas eustigma TaxID=1157962 RepID=A0A250WYC2_9CHLO|nr:hypothetical protein CEUSTIGMA_g3287.t1 [Chlamydomonas eustigma]|eukprot:GAX75844.1 hypothetical protein CEUSTIGMA_g3287.t1 [Chlamydomonas eustigma]
MKHIYSRCWGSLLYVIVEAWLHCAASLQIDYVRTSRQNLKSITEMRSEGIGTAPASSLACNVTCQAQQHQALLSLYNSTAGENWTVSSGWTTSSFHCAWFGVYCCPPTPSNLTSIISTPSQDSLTAQARWGLSCTPFATTLNSSDQPFVVAISLPGNNLRGSLPDTLFQTLGPSLQALDLQSNYITGSLPLSLMPSSSPVLMYLSLNNNHLEGSIPSSFAPESSRLQYLDLSSNTLTGTLPKGLSNLTSLTAIILSHNSFTGVVPVQLLLLPQLLSFLVGYNQFSGSISDIASDQWVEGISLDQIVMSHNMLTGRIPSFMGSMQIGGLDLSSNHLTGAIPPSLGSMEGLSALILNNNKLTGTIPALIQTPHLQVLQLQQNSLSGTLPSSLPWARDLVWLDVSQNKDLKGPLPSSGMSGLQSLQQLGLVGTSMRGTASVPGGTLLPSWLSLSTSSFALNQRNASLICPIVYLSSQNGNSPGVVVQIDPYYYAFQNCSCFPNTVTQRVLDPQGYILSVTCAQVSPSPPSSSVILWYVPFSIVMGVCLLLAATLALLWYLMGPKLKALKKEASLCKRAEIPGSAQPGKAVTLVLTDVEGSTELWEWDTEIVAVAIDLHDKLLRSYMSKFNGYEVMTEVRQH